MENLTNQFILEHSFTWIFFILFDESRYGYEDTGFNSRPV